MSRMTDPCDDILWGQLALGRHLTIRLAFSKDRKYLSGVIIDMQARAYGKSKPSSFVIVPVDEISQLASQHADDETGRAFIRACEEVGHRFSRRTNIGDAYFEDNGDMAVFANGNGAMVFDAGTALPFTRPEQAWLAKTLRPGAITTYRDTSSLERIIVRRASIYPAISREGVIGFKTRLVLNKRMSPQVVRDEIPPFEHLGYS